MKLKKIFFLLFIVSATQLFSDNRIILYLRHAPDEAVKTAEQVAHQTNLIEKLTKMESHTPAQASKKSIKYALQATLRPHLSGFLAIYGGYTDFSNQDGLISFPLRHTTPKIYIAITPNIKLVHVKGNTFSHREFIGDDENPVELYLFEFKTDDKQRNFWDVQKAPLPQDKKINALTMVILTHPKNIFIQEGKFLSVPNVQLVLPENVFVIDRSSNEHAVLQGLDPKTFFEPISAEQRKSSDTAVQSMITNL